ncbi:sugar kinase [Nonomuraea rhodomycinica]|uniref:Sugar kinase n=1 Tax=Nonomuraea rhodomycinica TaxID=1712872 RepID=A0A7Y6IX57_9ACTN|nr:sugar kinase [Nonomuraea rhodomycinica]NUW45488.1 sugar kinase [Nonomuraea rhodomycinica]
MASLHGGGPLRLGGSLELSMAGAEANVAIGLARLGHTARWAGVVGDDELGLLVLRTLRAEGVDVDTARTDPDHPTGLLVQERRVATITRVHYYRAGSAGSRLTSDDATAALAGGARMLHVTGITPALGPDAASAIAHAVRQARELGTRVCLDVNHRSRLWDRGTASRALAGLLPYVDVLVASADELPLVTGGAGPAGDGDVPALPAAGTGADEDVPALFAGGTGADGDVPGLLAGGTGADEDVPGLLAGGTGADEDVPGLLAGGTGVDRDVAALFAAGISEVVVKRGAAGAEAWTADGGHATSGAVPVRAVNTVGAGDAFVAGYLSGLLDGLPLGERLLRGVTVGAFAVASDGDWHGLPNRAELSLLALDEGETVR